MNRNVSTQVMAVVSTPIGKLRVAASPRGVCRIAFPNDNGVAKAPATAARQSGSPDERRRARAHLRAAIAQLREYFSGRRNRFDLPLDLAGTSQQQRVWRGLVAIPFGRTLSYGALAQELGSPGGARAVGHACATNPVPVVVPCHRVVGSDGALHGFGGGLWRKRALLELEGARLPLG